MLLLIFELHCITTIDNIDKISEFQRVNHEAFSEAPSSLWSGLIFKIENDLKLIGALQMFLSAIALIVT